MTGGKYLPCKFVIKGGGGSFFFGGKILILRVCFNFEYICSACIAFYKRGYCDVFNTGC